MKTAVAEDQLKSALHEYFGFEAFKGTQEKVIKSLMAGKDTVVIMPTGGGKSLCYQLPAILSKGTAIIVSPLIALMKNQVDLMRSYNSIDNIAHFLNSSLNKTQIKKVKEDITNETTKLLYIAPETLTKQENIDFFTSINVSFLAVDEAHCISEWGHDFRPEYRRIREMVSAIGHKIPIIALTATATPKVQSDIVKNLELDKPNIFISSFNRANLYYEVRSKGKKDQAQKEIIRYIKSNMGKSGIIYCLSRKTTEEVAQFLCANDIKAAAYHAGLEAPVRSKIQDKFLMDEVTVIVATIAFGMGIDKPDVRFVIHYNMPKSLENYYQETGRSGRDGLEGKCIAFFSHLDILKLEKFMRDKSVAERELGAQLIEETVAYAETAMCRRKFLLHYFGEEAKKDNCGSCDNCLNPKEKVEASEFIKLALETIIAVHENFGIEYIVNLMKGKKTQQIQSFDHDELEIFGEAEEKSEAFLNSIVRHAIQYNLIYKDVETYGLLKLTDKGKKFIAKPFKIEITVNHEYSIDGEPDADSDGGGGTSVVDPQLFNMLKAICKEVAKEHNLPPYVIFQDPSLEDMATQYPMNMEELSRIQGVSKGKAERYGKKFVELINKYVEENEIERPMDILVKSVVNKAGMKVYIIQNTDKKIPLEMIAKNKGLNMDELITEMESIVASGTRLNINYCIKDMLDENEQEIIYDYFRTAETDDLHAAMEELKDEGFTGEEIQLMRLKFMSEMAN